MIHWLIEPEVFLNDSSMSEALDELEVPYGTIKVGKSYEECIDDYVMTRCEEIPGDQIVIHGSYQ